MASSARWVEILKRLCPGFATMRHLVLSFRGIVCGGKTSSLKRWAEKAEASGLEAIRGFVCALNILAQFRRDQLECARILYCGTRHHPATLDLEQLKEQIRVVAAARSIR
jgi:hypothetical protein